MTGAIIINASRVKSLDQDMCAGSGSLFQFLSSVFWFFIDFSSCINCQLFTDLSKAVVSKNMLLLKVS